MKKYPSINQFRNVIREVRERHDYKGKDENGKPIYLHDTPYPTISFKGTVKIHGTNAAIVRYKDGTIKYQSREREITPESDNMWFASYMSGIDLNPLFDIFNCSDYVAIYGEWCGQGIQKGVAVSMLPKMFVIFGVMVDDEWIEYDTGLEDGINRIYNILQFGSYIVDIDFNTPELAQNRLIELTLSVENECPVGKSFGVSGIGEGLVFTSTIDPSMKFKSKGDKHSVSKVKKLNPVDTEMMETINELIDYIVTENRLEQGIEYIKSNNQSPFLDIKYVGDFIRWVVNDAHKEESDTIDKSGIDVKKVNSSISQKAKNWYLKRI